MDEWAKTWLRREREKGAKCLEIKYISGKPYVYHSTSRYDKTTKSPRKVSTYLGRLTEDQGLIPKGTRKNRETETVTWIVEPPAIPAPDAPELEDEYTGDAAFLQEDTAFLIPEIKEHFPDCWQQFVHILHSRVGEYSCLTKEMGFPGEGLLESEDQEGKESCRTLVMIGKNTCGQQAISSHLLSGTRLIAYPFSLAGNSSECVLLRQILIFVDASSGLPVMIRKLRGPGADMIADAILEMAPWDEETGEIILLINPEEHMLMAGHKETGAEPDLTPFLERGITYISPLPYESIRYDTPLYLTDHFTRGDRLILTGSTDSGGIITYLYKDVRAATEEAEELFSVFEKGAIDRRILKRQLKRAGRTLIESSMRVEPEEMYELIASEDWIFSIISLIREMEPVGQPYARADDDAITGSLFLNLLAAHIIHLNKEQVRTL